MVLICPLFFSFGDLSLSLFMYAGYRIEVNQVFFHNYTLILDLYKRVRPRTNKFAIKPQL